MKQWEGKAKDDKIILCICLGLCKSIFIIIQASKTFYTKIFPYIYALQVKYSLLFGRRILCLFLRHYQINKFKFINKIYIWRNEYSIVNIWGFFDSNH